MRRDGSASPDEVSAARTRSRASDTALSAKPTTLKAGSPGATCTWTVTLRASIPSNATVATRWTMPASTANPAKTSANCWRRQEHLQNIANQVNSEQRHKERRERQVTDIERFHAGAPDGPRGVPPHAARGTLAAARAARID